MRKLTIHLCLLALMILFSQCAGLRFKDRKYTKGRYHEHSKELAVKKHDGGKTRLPAIDHKTELSADTKAPVEKNNEEAVTAASTPKTESAVAPVTMPATEALPKADHPKKPTIKLSKRAAVMLARAPFSERLLKESKRSEARSSDGREITCTILSIIGFVLGVGALVLMFVGLIDSILIEGVSAFLLVAIVFGIAAVGLGITTLVMGRGDIGGVERTFAILAIVFGTIGALLALLWSAIFLGIDD